MKHEHAHNYKIIKIPGDSTEADNEPKIQILGGGHNPLEFIIKYHTGLLKGTKLVIGKITFTNVLEYRWISDVVWYYPYGDDKNFTFGLVEIFKSKYIEDMASKGKFRNYSDKRFGPTIDEINIRHFRLSFDEYGYFDIIAFRVDIEEIFD
ncbi:MAG: hypothetical protein HXX20_20250 [Chloroflexi bacterium]|nr:hypothetical protein [Chloroflexota bacterium]